jgi:hypothetical protein
MLMTLPATAMGQPFAFGFEIVEIIKAGWKDMEWHRWNTESDANSIGGATEACDVITSLVG